jgi:hypothetical protein
VLPGSEFAIGGVVIAISLAMATLLVRHQAQLTAEAERALPGPIRPSQVK